MAKAAKTTLAITREQFRTHAQPVVVVINGRSSRSPERSFPPGRSAGT
jgi:hypothetical protein